MDVFPSIESANNVLVKLVAAFNKVENNINENSFDISSQIRRLPVSEYWQDRKQYLDDEDEAAKLSDITLCSLTIAMTAVFMVFLFLLYWGMCQKLQEFLTLRYVVYTALYFIFLELTFEYIQKGEERGLQEVRSRC